MKRDALKEAVLGGDYDKADQIATKKLLRSGSTCVMARASDDADNPRIGAMIGIVQDREHRYRLWLDHEGGLPQDNRAMTAWPPAGIATATEAVRRARSMLADTTPRTLTRVQHERTSFTAATGRYREIARTADRAIAADERIEEEYRADPAQLNILTTLIDNAERATTTSREAVYRFIDVLRSAEFATATGGDHTELTALARGLADNLHTLIGSRESVKLSLMEQPDE